MIDCRSITITLPHAIDSTLSLNITRMRNHMITLLLAHNNLGSTNNFDITMRSALTRAINNTRTTNTPNNNDNYNKNIQHYYY